MKFNLKTIFLITTVIALGLCLAIAFEWQFPWEKSYPNLRTDLLKDAPHQVETLVELLEIMPSNCTLKEFGIRIEKLGLSTEPDHYKDFNYFWKIKTGDSDFPRCSLFAKFLPKPGFQDYILQEATISVNTKPSVEREYIWLIDYQSN